MVKEIIKDLKHYARKYIFNTKEIIIGEYWRRNIQDIQKTNRKMAELI